MFKLLYIIILMYNSLIQQNILLRKKQLQKRIDEDILGKYNDIMKIRNSEKKNNTILDNQEKEIKINNLPYKQIMSMKDYGRDDYKKNHNQENFNKNILVYKTNEQDKDIDKFENELKDKKKDLIEHNNTLKKIYTDENKKEHIEKFEYRQTFTNQNSLDHNELKKETQESYKLEQEEWEKDNIKISNLLNNLTSKGII